MGVPLDNEGLIKNSVSVTLLGTPSKVPAYHQMCATTSWLSCIDYQNKGTLRVPPDNEGLIKILFQ